MISNKRVWIVSFFIAGPGYFGLYFLSDYLKRQEAIQFNHEREERILAQIETAFDAHDLGQAEYLLLSSAEALVHSFGQDQALDDRFEKASSKLKAWKRRIAEAFDHGTLVVREPISRSYTIESSDEEKVVGEPHEDLLPAETRLESFKVFCHGFLARLDRMPTAIVGYGGFSDPDNEYLRRVSVIGQEVVNRFAPDYVLELRKTQLPEPGYVGQLEVVGYHKWLVGNSDKNLAFSQKTFPEIVDILTQRAQKRAARSLGILGQEYVDEYGRYLAGEKLRKYRFTFAAYNQDWILQDCREQPSYLGLEGQLGKMFDAVGLGRAQEPLEIYYSRHRLYAYVMSALGTRAMPWLDD